MIRNGVALRDGSWDFAIADDVFADEASYVGYDRDPELDRIRQEMFGPICREMVRVQPEIPDPEPEREGATP